MLRREDDRDYEYLRDRQDRLTSSVGTVIDTVGQLAGQVGQLRVDAEKHNTALTEGAKWMAVSGTLIPDLRKDVDANSESIKDGETRISKLERWQSYTLGMAALIAAEIPIAIGLVAAHPWKP